MKKRRENWSRDELIIAFNLYCRTPFGRMHKSNPEIIQLAERLGRTPSAVAMKMVNLASMDPAQQKRNIKGLSHASSQDTLIWNEFNQNWENLAFESQRALENLSKGIKKDEDDELSLFVGSDIATEGERITRIRLVQRFFRDAVLSSYNFSCAICELNMAMMLNASHIIPWAADKSRRADPRNGLSLCAFHDRAFDKGLITVDESFKIVLSKMVRIINAPKLHKVGLLEIEGQKIKLPDKFRPEQVCFAYHRENVFLQ